MNLVVETGTFKGESTEIMAQNFDRVITIELDEKLHSETSKRLLDQGYSNIEFLLGDSGQHVDELSKRIQEPAIFFLDAFPQVS